MNEVEQSKSNGNTIRQRINDAVENIKNGEKGKALNKLLSLIAAGSPHRNRSVEIEIVKMAYPLAVELQEEVIGVMNTAEHFYEIEMLASACAEAKKALEIYKNLGDKQGIVSAFSLIDKIRIKKKKSNINEVKRK